MEESMIYICKRGQYNHWKCSIDELMCSGVPFNMTLRVDNINGAHNMCRIPCMDKTCSHDMQPIAVQVFLILPNTS